MMKNPPGLWLLLSAGVLWLCLQDVSCVRATSLIFGKSTTTTTAPGDTSSNSTALADGETATMDVTTPPSNTTNTTQRVLTGIPQVDYLGDPNLPRELNGLNLTDYPFYDRVPEEIDFKCDGLHDGFYASVPHKCQVYHHCLYGTRYDFLCANYTAFDQRTFICHFVSEVDCVNSKNFWHRNDALYEAQSTTTIKPLIVYAPPPPPAILTGGGAPRRPQNQPDNQRRRKPARRRRPQYDYYDEYDEADEEYFDEPRYTATEAAPRGEGRRRNKRPRPRPRPVYDDEYEEDYEERYDRRRGNSRRNRPTSRRNKEDRRKYEDEYEEYEDEDPRFDRAEGRNKKPKEESRRRPMEEEKKPEKRTEERKRDEKRPSDDRRYDKRKQDKEENEEDVDRRPARPMRKGARRPVDDDYQDDDRRSTKRKEEAPSASAEDIKPLVKPAGSSLFDRPRVAPRVRPPVPKSEADKYAYKTTIGPVPVNPSKVAEDEEYYDEYEEEPPLSRKRPTSKDSQADASITSNSRKSNKNRERDRDRDREEPKNRNRPKVSRRPQDDEEYYEDEEERPVKRSQKPKNEERRVGQGSRKRPATIDYDEEVEEEIKPRESAKEEREERKATPSSTTISSRRKYGGSERKDFLRSKLASTTTTTTTTSTTTTTTEAPKKEDSPAGNSYKSVRVVKRPFLPSRGGNPYISRGLQPIGLKSESQNTQESRQSAQVSQESSKEEEDVPKPGKQMRNKPHQDVVVEDYRPRPTQNRGSIKAGSKEKESIIVAKPTAVEKNPLDINENEYDVTLNDALNPTLPNLPLRPFSTGFGNNVNNNEYTFGAFHRPRYVVDATINSASSEYQYRYKPPQPQPQSQASSVRYEAKQSNGHTPQHIQLQVRQPESHQDFQAQYSTNYQQFRPSPRVQHTQAFYTTY